MMKAKRFPLGNRLTAWFLTLMAVSLNAWGQGAAWRDTRLPGGARITALAHGPGPDSPSRAVLAGDDAGHVFRSADGGATWSRVLTRAGAPVAAFAAMEGFLLAGAGRAENRTTSDCWSPGCAEYYSAGGVFRSTDGGSSWMRLPDSKSVSAFAVKGKVLYASTGDMLLASSDYGVTWKEIAAPGPRPFMEGVTGLEWVGESLFARTSAGLWVSQAGAEGDWKKLDESYDGGMAVMGAFLIRSVRPNPFRMANPPVTDTLKRSRDGGVTWERLAKAGYRRLAALGTRLYGFSDSTLGESLDSGRTWRSPVPPWPGMGKVEAALSVGGDLWIGGGDGSGVRALKTGGSAWVSLNDGMHARPVSGLAVQGGSVFAAVGDSLMRYRGRAGAGWENAWAGMTGAFSAQSVLTLGGRVYAGGGNGILVSASGGGSGTWKTASTVPAGNLSPGGEWIVHYRDDTRTLAMCHAGETLACSNSPLSGFPPVRISPNPFNPVQTNGFLSLAFSGDEVVVALQDSLYRSTDRGATWTLFGAPPAPVSFLAYERGNLILGSKGATGRESLFRWTVSPEGWEGYGDGLRGAPAAVAFRGEAETYVATDSGVFRKGRWEGRWEDLSGDLADKEVHTLAVGGDTLAIGLDNGEVRILALDPITGLGSPARRGAIRTKIRIRAGLIPDGAGRWVRPDGRAAMTTAARK